MIMLPVVAALAALSHQPTSCLRYEPDTVIVTGRLVVRTFYGPPGYGDDPRHDARERGYYVNVPTPVCTAAGQDADVQPAQRGVRSIQLVLDSAGRAALKPRLGRTITLRGTLFASETGHHHVPLLMTVVSQMPAR